MSISASLSNAMSGLAAVSRSAELVSANVANAMTEGYGRRELSLGADTVGGRGAGVRVVGVERVVNQVAVADRRLADASLGYHQGRAAFFSTMERTIGSPDQMSSLSAQLDRFDQALISAAATPSSEARLAEVANSAAGIVSKFGAISDRLMAERETADRGIGEKIDHINDALEDVARLNLEIRKQMNSGGSPAGLMDQRQAVVDQISDLIPIQEVQRDHGQIALLTANGTTLVDYQAARLEFTVTPVITPDMSLSTGSLSGLVISGASSSSGSALASIAGGGLAAAFELRDADIPQVQSNLDALARDLIERSALADTSIGPGRPGLFTDGGTLLNPADELGLAGRLSLNAAIDPAQGGAIWRIRAGMEATSPGAASDNINLSALLTTLSAQRTPSSGRFNDAGSSSALVSDFVSQIGQMRQSSQLRQSFEATKVQAFRDVEQGSGVDTDQEMQKLLLIEQNFAANAKVIQAVDEMLQSLLRI